MTIKKLMTFLIAGNVAMLSLVLAAYFFYKNSQENVSLAYQKQYHSYLLADELRQSSDDLTRLGRTYVVTGDEKYEKQYFDILDIRSGKKPRPEGYHRIYWDLYTIDMKPPRPDSGQKISLLDLMKQEGFTDEEFTLLKESQANSDGLVNLEVKAMNAVKGVFADTNGQYTIKGDPDFAMARQLVHSEEYHRYKADIVKPLDRFYVALEERTSRLVAEAESISQAWSIILMSLLAILLAQAIATGWLIINRVVRPLQGMNHMMLELSSDNLDLDIAGQDRKDEIGDMAKALVVFKDNGLEKRQLDKQQAAEQLEKEQKTAKLEQINKSFTANIDNLMKEVGASVNGLLQQSEHMNQAAAESSDLSMQVAAASQEASTNVETVAAATAELSASIAEIARQVNGSSETSSAAVSEAKETNEKVKSLQEAAMKIGEVVSLINDIADQTNLLALNATIEAARAGEAGKGFAVVASEVKGLANQTAKATGDISTQIKEMQTATEAAVLSISEIVDTIGSIDEIAATIAASVEEQDSATQEITRNIEQAANGTQEVNRNIDGVNKTIGSARDTADSLSKASNYLANKSKELEQLIKIYVSDVQSI